MLTTKLQQYVELTISDDSKAKLMRKIGQYYITLLEEFFIVNSGSKSHHSRSSQQDPEEFHFDDMWHNKLAEQKENHFARTTFEKVINELRNIEYVLNYFIGISNKNKKQRFSRIQSNDSLFLRQEYQSSLVLDEMHGEKSPV